MTPRQRTARHEGAHASMAVVLDTPVQYVTTIPKGRMRGHVSLSPPNTASHALILLAALIEEDNIPDWPISDPGSRDEVDLRDLIDQFNISEKQYRRLVITALTVAASREYQRLVTAITCILDYTPVLDRDLLSRVVTIAERNS
jgi:hypothetical protein